MIKPEHKYFYGLFLCSLLGNLLVVAMPLIMGIGIDDLLSQIRKTGIGQLTFSDIKQALLFPVLLLIGCSVLSSVASFIQERTMAALSEKITLRVRKEITKIQNIADVVFDNHQVGDIISRTTTGLNQLSQVLLTGINQFFTSVVTIVAAGLMLFYIESKLTLLVLLLIVGSSIVTTKIANKTNRFLNKTNMN